VFLLGLLVVLRTYVLKGKCACPIGASTGTKISAYKAPKETTRENA